MPPEEPKQNYTVYIALAFAVLVIGGAATIAYAPFSGTPAQSDTRIQKNVPAVSSTDYVQGDRKAPVAIVEYADLESLRTKEFNATMGRIMSDYPEKVVWVMRAFPLGTVHPGAPRLALAAECAGVLGGNDVYWKFINAVFAASGPDGVLAPTLLTSVGETAGLTAKDFDACIASGTYQKKVNDEFADAVAAGAAGSPFSVLITPDGAQIAIAGAQSYENVQAAIDAALNNK